MKIHTPRQEVLGQGSRVLGVLGTMNLGRVLTRY